MSRAYDYERMHGNIRPMSTKISLAQFKCKLLEKNTADTLTNIFWRNIGFGAVFVWEQFLIVLHIVFFCKWRCTEILPICTHLIWNIIWRPKLDAYFIYKYWSPYQTHSCKQCNRMRGFGLKLAVEAITTIFITIKTALGHYAMRPSLT